jgi:hypothetical protein
VARQSRTTTPPLFMQEVESNWHLEGRSWQNVTSDNIKI